MEKSSMLMMRRRGWPTTRPHNLPNEWLDFGEQAAQDWRVTR